MARTIKRRRRKVERVPSSYIYKTAAGLGARGMYLEQPLYKNRVLYTMRIYIYVYTIYLHIDACEMNSRIDDR